jgi:hypothetical protein
VEFLFTAVGVAKLKALRNSKQNHAITAEITSLDDNLVLDVGRPKMFFVINLVPPNGE